MATPLTTVGTAEPVGPPPVEVYVTGVWLPEVLTATPPVVVLKVGGGDSVVGVWLLVVTLVVFDPWLLLRTTPTATTRAMTATPIEMALALCIAPASVKVPRPLSQHAGGSYDGSSIRSTGARSWAGRSAPSPSSRRDWHGCSDRTAGARTPM